MSVRWCFTGRCDGDLAPSVPTEELSLRRRRLADAPWTWLEQVHGAEVVTVTAPGEGAGRQADASVTTARGAVLAVHTADCAPVLLHGHGPSGTVIGAAHAGWRGLVAGVLGASVAAMRELGATSVTWRLGPCISPAAYEFGAEDLEEVAEVLGPTVRSRTPSGAAALDLRAGVRAALAGTGAVPAAPLEQVPCTVEDPGWFSWRRDRTTCRQAGLIWIDGPDQPARLPAADRAGGTAAVCW